MISHVGSKGLGNNTYLLPILVPCPLPQRHTRTRGRASAGLNGAPVATEWTRQEAHPIASAAKWRSPPISSTFYFPFFSTI